MKRLDLSSHARRRAEWTGDRDIGWHTHLFSSRAQHRRASVLVDDELLEEFRIPPSPAGLLSEMLRSRFVTVLRHSDDGPPAGMDPVRGAYYPGWVKVVGRRDERWDITFPTGAESFTYSSVQTRRTDFAERDERSAVYAELDPAAAAARRSADALGLGVAASVGADIFVTERPYLHRPDAAPTGVTICRPGEAVAILGLYLRAQGQYQITRDYGLDRGMFFWVAARDLLPAGWRWFSACVYSSHSQTDDSLMGLGGALLGRMDRALRARDQLFVALNQPQTSATSDDVAAALDMVVILLMACVDVTARVAHFALDLPGSERDAAWQRTSWVKDVRKQARDLAALVDTGAEHRDTLEVLRLLRNSVHGEALESSLVQHAGRGTECQIHVPRSDKEDVLAAVERRGGRSAWGVEDGFDGRLVLDAGVFVDRLVLGVVALLNDVMDGTPVHELDGLPGDVVLSQGPPEPSHDLLDAFGPATRQCVRWQLGV